MTNQEDRHIRAIAKFAYPEINIKDMRMEEIHPLFIPVRIYNQPFNKFYLETHKRRLFIRFAHVPEVNTIYWRSLREEIKGKSLEYAIEMWASDPDMVNDTVNKLIEKYDIPLDK